MRPLRQRARRQISAEQPCAMTVAMAAPSTPISKEATKSRSSEILTAQAKIIARSGVPTIAHGAEDGGKEVEGHDYRQAPEDDAYVGKRGIDDGRGVSSTRSTKGVSSWAAAVSATAQMAESEQALPMVRRRPAPSPRAELLRHAHGEALRQPLNDGEHHPVEPVHPRPTPPSASRPSTRPTMAVSATV